MEQVNAVQFFTYSENVIILSMLKISKKAIDKLIKLIYNAIKLNAIKFDYLN